MSSKDSDRIIRKEDRNALWLYWYFVRAGAMAIGSGGMLIVLQIKKDFTDRYHWITEEEVWNLYGVGRGIPGLMISDVVCIFGYNLYGIMGAIAAVLGIATVPVCCIIGVEIFYDLFRDNYWIAGILEGVRAVVVPILLTSLLSNAKTAHKYRICFAITAVSFLMYSAGMSILSVVIVDILLGLLIGAAYRRKASKVKGEST